MQYDVYGVGNALVDIQARVSDATLQKLGFAKGIMTLVDEEIQQKVLGELDGAPISQCAGGSAANTILGIADFGGKAAYAGKVGSDMLGEFDLAEMRKLGVTIEVPPAAEGQTGTCVVLITDDAQRTMLTNLFTGETQKRAAYRAIELAKKHGVKVAFTVSDPFLINLFRDEFQELIEGPVDLLFCNLEEARSLTGKHDAVDCAHVIHNHVPNLALTLGGDGSILMHEGRVIPIEGVDVEAIDTTGAGDMYAAGILYGITNELTWHQAGHLASRAAARIVSQLGARLKKPFTQDEIQELLN